MTSEFTLERWMEIGQQLKANMYADPGLKDELMEDPKAVIEKISGLDIPNDVDLKIVEDSSTAGHLILPFISGFDRDNMDLGPDHELYCDIIGQFEQDAEFRKQLLKDPKSTLEENLQLRFPEGYRINVLQETAQHRYIQIPYIGNPDDYELEDDDLRLVAGGGDVYGSNVHYNPNK